jgi:hypothetical protein
MPSERPPSPVREERVDLSELSVGQRHRAEIVFGVLSFAVALLLLTRIGAETSWLEGRPFVRQPAFWPTVAIAGMTIFGVFELWSTARALRRASAGEIGTEVLKWFAALEYLAWFLGYVWVVPVLGYLPTTVVFCAALSYRLGYRSRRGLAAAVLTGIATVVIFKSLLGVKIPGGSLYEYLPGAVRNVMILYF